MPITSIYAVVAVSDLDRGRDFYQRLMGRPADAAPMPGLLEWHQGDSGIQLLHDPERAGRSTLTPLVDDLAAERAALAARGLTLGKGCRGGAATVARIDDPDGNRIFLAQPGNAWRDSSAEHPHADTIRRCFQAYRDKDRAALEPLLADDFTFTSPYDDAIGRAAYFQRCWPNSERIREHVIERILVEGEAAFVTYLARIVDGSEFRNTEFMTFAGGRIASVHVYFGESYRDGRFVPKS